MVIVFIGIYVYKKNNLFLCIKIFFIIIVTGSDRCLNLYLRSGTLGGNETKLNTRLNVLYLPSCTRGMCSSCRGYMNEDSESEYGQTFTRATEE